MLEDIGPRDDVVGAWGEGQIVVIMDAEEAHQLARGVSGFSRPLVQVPAVIDFLVHSIFSVTADGHIGSMMPSQQGSETLVAAHQVKLLGADVLKEVGLRVDSHLRQIVVVIYDK